MEKLVTGKEGVDVVGQLLEGLTGVVALGQAGKKLVELAYGKVAAGVAAGKRQAQPPNYFFGQGARERAEAAHGDGLAVDGARGGQRCAVERHAALLGQVERHALHAPAHAAVGFGDFEKVGALHVAAVAQLMRPGFDGVGAMW